jgi:ATP-dependent RNA helicase DbpA
MTAIKFSSLPLTAEMLSNLESLGYNEMTPIQAQSLPIILQGQDIIAKAKPVVVKPLRLELVCWRNSM